MRFPTLLLSPVLCLTVLALLPAQDTPDLGAADQGAAAGQGKSLVDRSSPLQVVEPDEGDRALRMTPVVRAVQRAADSVVSIYLQNQLASGEPVTEGQGSGVLLDDSGLIITNWHVIAPVLLGERRGRSYGVIVKLRDGRERKARILSSTPVRDLALLQIIVQGSERFQPIEIARSSDLMIGETVVAIGNPQGHANTVTTGVLSAIGRSIQVRAPDGQIREYKDLLQTDAAINQGNSGGALLDITGRLIGINNAMSASAENIGFAIPMDIVRQEFTRELLQSTSFVASGNAPWLGLEVADRDGKVVVTEIVRGGPANLADIRTGDVLSKIGSHDVRTSIDYLRHLFGLANSRTVPVTVQREGREVIAQTEPIPRHEGTILATIGVRPSEITVDANERLVRKATEAFYRGSGLRRVRLFPSVIKLGAVLAGSAADATGFEPGDLLLGYIAQGRYGDRELPIPSLIDFANLLESQRGNKLRFIILRGDRDLVGTLEVPSKTATSVNRNR
ncbi:MAG: serine protease Do [Planctomycetota bacterium]|jgi:serine protease Do